MIKSKELLQLELCQERHHPLTKQQENKLYNLAQGYMGEATFDKLLRTNGSVHWKILSDYWFKLDTLHQIDSLIISANEKNEIEITLAEIKNYQRDASYKNGKFLLAGKPHSEDIMHRMHERMRSFQQLLTFKQLKVKLQGVMIFINEKGQVDVDRRFNFDIITKDQLNNYLSWRKVLTDYPNPEIKSIASDLENYRVKTNFPLVDTDWRHFASLWKGISCKYCRSGLTTASYKTIDCRHCGKKENKHDTIIRLAKELQLIFHADNEIITSKNLSIFCADMINRKTIAKVLGEHFPRIGSTWGTYYNVTLD